MHHRCRRELPADRLGDVVQPGRGGGDHRRHRAHRHRCGQQIRQRLRGPGQGHVLPGNHVDRHRTHPRPVLQRGTHPGRDPVGGRRHRDVPAAAPVVLDPVLGHRQRHRRQVEHLPAFRGHHRRVGQPSTAAPALPRACSTTGVGVGALAHRGTRITIVLPGPATTRAALRPRRRRVIALRRRWPRGVPRGFTRPRASNPATARTGPTMPAPARRSACPARPATPATAPPSATPGPGTTRTRAEQHPPAGGDAGPDTRTLPDPTPRSRRHADKRLSGCTALQREGASGTACEPTMHTNREHAGSQLVGGRVRSDRPSRQSYRVILSS